MERDLFETRQTTTGMELHAKLTADIGILLHSTKNEAGQVLERYEGLAIDLRRRREGIKRMIDTAVKLNVLRNLKHPVATRAPETLPLPPQKAEEIRYEIERLFTDGSEQLRMIQTIHPRPLRSMMLPQLYEGISELGEG